MTGRQILKDIMASRGIGPKDFFGTSRMTHLVRARRQAIRQLKAQGFSIAAISRLMKRNYSTVQYWVHPNYRARQVAYSLNYWARKSEQREAA